jgi:DNA helicase-2/ATP-dependent DNA helicase PcrA
MKNGNLLHQCHRDLRDLFMHVDDIVQVEILPSTIRTLEQQKKFVADGTSKTMNSLHLITPQRFFTHGQKAHGDRHVYASRTRFIPAPLLQHFECKAWPVATAEQDKRTDARQVRIDVAARMRGMWR